jgi:hypothetical protein
MADLKLEKFEYLAGAKCYWARVNEAYEDYSKALEGKRKLNPGFKKKLEACLIEVWWTLGAPTPIAIVSSGAYVKKAGWHSKGKAFDLGAIHWEDYHLSCLGVFNDGCSTSSSMPMYLAIESVLRKHFGTVLGIHYNKAHRNHWHIDPGTKVGYWSKGFGSSTRVIFLQEVLRLVWNCKVVIDGKAGPQTNSAIRIIRDMLHIGPLTNVDNWKQFLLLTAMKAAQM